MKKIVISFILISVGFMSLCAKSISRKDALEYFKKRNIYGILACDSSSKNAFRLENKYDSIQLTGRDFSHVDLKYLSAFPEVEFFNFGGALKLKDIHFKYISNFPKLYMLDFRNIRITGSGFRYMKNLPRLEEIDLTGTRVSDKTIQYLKKFKSLRFIGLCKTKVTQRGIARLKKYLPNCHITKYCENDGNQE